MALSSRKCPACGTWYQPRRKDSVACSTACSSLAFVRKNRDALNASRRVRARVAAGIPTTATETELRRIVARAQRLPEVVSYETAHKRVAAERGKASAHICADCAEQAEQWSYTHDDPDELHGATRRQDNVAYSADSQFYAPRCRPCHLRFDLAHARKEVFA